MTQKFKNTIALTLLWVFLFPTIAKVEHHHEVFSCDVKGRQHFHYFHQKCDICSFEFSFFEATPSNIYLHIEQVVIDFYTKHNPPNYFSPTEYSFLLRAPPSRQA